MRTLVLYYSNTGNTRIVAERLAGALDAELGEITCGAYLRWYGPALMFWDIFTRRRPRVTMITPPHAHYDLTIIGGPVWSGRAAPPVLRVLADHGDELGRVGLFVTCRGVDPNYGPEPALADMASFLPAGVVDSRFFREAEIRSGAYGAEVDAFARALRAEAPQP